MKEQLRALTGLRGVAAYSVLISHSINSSFTAGRLAYFGISLFFVLSGFVIHYNYADLIRSKGLRAGGYQFFVARFARLFPLYAVAIFFSFQHVTDTVFHNNPGAGLAYLTLTQSWFDFQRLICPPTWSISTEWFFYLFFIIFAASLERIRRPVVMLGVVLVVTPIFLLGLFSLKSDIMSLLSVLWRVPATNEEWGWVLYYSPYVRIFEFIAGIFASKIYLSMRGSQRPATLLSSLGGFLCVGYCAAIIFHGPESGALNNLVPNYIYAPAITLLLLICCLYDTVLSRIVSSRLLVFMGEISYSVYIWSFWMITALSGSFILTKHGHLDAVARVIAVSSLTTMVAYGSYHLLENPCRIWIRRFLDFSSRRAPIEAIPAVVTPE